MWPVHLVLEVHRYLNAKVSTTASGAKTGSCTTAVPARNLKSDRYIKCAGQIRMYIYTGLGFQLHAVRSVRPSPPPTAASRKAAERPRAVSRVELSVVESRSNSFRRSPEHLWPCRSCRRRQGQTCTHDSRDDLLQSRAVRTTRSTGWSNSTSGQFVRFAPCDLGVAAQHLVSSSAAVQ